MIYHSQTRAVRQSKHQLAACVYCANISPLPRGVVVDVAKEATGRPQAWDLQPLGALRRVAGVCSLWAMRYVATLNG
jgi:hypothetical protein